MEKDFLKDNLTGAYKEITEYNMKMLPKWLAIGLATAAIVLGTIFTIMGLISYGSTWNVEGNTVNVTVLKNDTTMNLKAGTKIIEPE